MPPLRGYEKPARIRKTFLTKLLTEDNNEYLTRPW